jgi:hypothetical protein
MNLTGLFHCLATPLPVNIYVIITPNLIYSRLSKECIPRDHSHFPARQKQVLNCSLHRLSAFLGLFSLRQLLSFIHEKPLMFPYHLPPMRMVQVAEKQPVPLNNTPK